MIQIGDMLVKIQLGKKNNDYNENDDLERAIMESMKEFNNQTTPKNDYSNEINTLDGEEMDFDMELALKLSLQTESNKPVEIVLPEEPSNTEPNTTLLAIRLPDGNKIERRFRWREKISDIYTVVLKHGFDIKSGKYKLFSQFPTVIYNDESKTLEDLELKNNCALFVSLT